MPSLVLEVARTRSGTVMSAGVRRVVKQAGGLELVWTRRTRIKSSVNGGVVRRRVVEAGVKFIVCSPASSFIVQFAVMKGQVVVIEQPVRYQVRRVPVFRILEVDIAGVVPPAATPITAPHVIGLVLPEKKLLPATVSGP